MPMSSGEILRKVAVESVTFQAVSLIVSRSGAKLTQDFKRDRRCAMTIPADRR